MGRQKKEFSELPTAKLRGKLWTRYVRNLLIPGKENGKPLAHLINGAIISVADKIPAVKKIIKASNLDGEEIVSRGRWKGWWDGEHPHPDKVALINMLAPDSKCWFVSQVSQSLSIVYWETAPNTDLLGHPIHTLLYALDLWASKKEESDRALLLTKRISDIWRPRTQVARTDDAGGRQITGWYISPAKCDLVDSTILHRFNLLEPPSIVNFMLWFGYTYSIHKFERYIFLKWTFDLLSASLAAAKMIEDFGGDVSFFLGGKTADSATLVRQLLMLKAPDIDAPYLRGKIQSKIKICIGAAGDADFLPHSDDDKFIDLLIEMCRVFNDELRSFSVSIEDLKLVKR